MTSRASKQSIFWGVFLILLAVLLVVDQRIEVGVWVWFGLLALAGLTALGFYLADRSDWAMLLAGYVLLAIALLIALTALDILRDDSVAVYVLLVIALPFVVVFYRDRAQWWALIPAYVLVVVAVMVGLLGLGLLSDLMVPAYVLFAIAIPFFVVYGLDRKNWWALIPGGVLALIGLFFLIAEAGLAYIGGFLLILGGVLVLVRAFTRRDAPVGKLPEMSDAQAPTGREDGDQGRDHDV